MRLETRHSKSMTRSMLITINELRQMTVAELRSEWLRLYGEPSRSRNREYLFRRLAWRVQELAYGGLSARAKARIAELAPESFARARTPLMANDTPAAASDVASPRSPRYPRLPSPGTVLVREYRDRELRLTVLESGFELDGTVYGSLSEAARAVTGSKWNGRLFWGLTKRKRV